MTALFRLARFAAVMTAGATMASLAALPAQAQTITLTASTWAAASHPVTQTMVAWGQEVERVTAGRVKVRLLPKPVATPAGTYDAVRSGVADVSFSVHGYTPGRFVLTKLAELPLMGASAETTSVAYQRVHDRHLARAGEHEGVKVLALFTHGPGMVFSSQRPVLEPADLRGLKFRVGGGMSHDIGMALGAHVTLKPATEAQELIRAGVMDGAFFPAEAITTFGLQTLVKHVTEVPGGLYNTSFVMLMNLERWQALPNADRAAIDSVSGEKLARALGRAVDARDREGRASMQAHGIQLHRASPALTLQIRQSATAFEQQWIAQAQARGITQPQRVLEEFRLALKGS
jgi:TRAP-type transport system periplasmic protein